MQDNMGAITKHHRYIRNLRKDITHIQLTFDYDKNCKRIILQNIDRLTTKQQAMFSNLMVAKDLKDLFSTDSDIDVALDTISQVLTWLTGYRKYYRIFDECTACSHTSCQCTQRYKINEMMNGNTIEITDKEPVRSNSFRLGHHRMLRSPKYVEFFLDQYAKGTEDIVNGSCLTVKDIMAKLEAFDPDMKVVINIGEGYYGSIARINSSN